MTASAARRVLVLAYYFPPMGLSGVQRTAKFVKYLPEHGWDPVVLTVLPRGYFAFDQTLLDELEARQIRIVRTQSFDPTRLFPGNRHVALPGEAARSRLSAVSQWLLLPDNKIGWAPYAMRAGGRLLREGGFSAIYSSAPPYSSHLIAARLARRYRVPLVVDYRDDWLDNPRHWYPTRLHRWIHARQERRVSDSADAVVTINPIIGKALRRRHEAPVTLISQGFDPDDYPEEPYQTTSDKLEFVYAGIFYDKQTPDPFLRGLHRLMAEEPALRSRVRATFVGLFSDRARALVQRLGLESLVRVLPYATQREAMVRVAEAQVPWLIVGAGKGQEQISTGKLYAYIGSRKPILGLVPPGAARKTLETYGASWIAHPDRPEEIDLVLRRIVRLWLEGNLPEATNHAARPYSRVGLAGRLAEVLNRVSS
jgi:glycosyltransferase involved in cell wall biosynthesis